jgi:hypothetical protein
MKKFLIIVFILAVLAGFFFGWAQMGIPPDSIGILYSKSHGIVRLIQPGEFLWVWYKLIPANTHTLVFRLNRVQREFSAKDILPSGMVYSAFTGTNSDFSWELSAAFSFSLRPGDLLAIAAEANIGSQEELSLYEGETAEQIKAFIIRRMNMPEEYLNQIETLLKNGESPELEADIQKQYPHIENFSLWVKSAKLPDFALYRQVRELYENYITFQKDLLSGELGEQAKSRSEMYLRFGELELYGALLTKYPVLLDFLAMENSKK